MRDKRFLQIVLLALTLTLVGVLGGYVYKKTDLVVNHPAPLTDNQILSTTRNKTRKIVGNFGKFKEPALYEYAPTAKQLDDVIYGLRSPVGQPKRYRKTKILKKDSWKLVIFTTLYNDIIGTPATPISAYNLKQLKSLLTRSHLDTDIDLVDMNELGPDDNGWPYPFRENCTPVGSGNECYDRALYMHPLSKFYNGKYFFNSAKWLAANIRFRPNLDFVPVGPHDYEYPAFYMENTIGMFPVVVILDPQGIIRAKFLGSDVTLEDTYNIIVSLRRNERSNAKPYSKIANATQLEYGKHSFTNGVNWAGTTAFSKMQDLINEFSGEMTKLGLKMNMDMDKNYIYNHTDYKEIIRKRISSYKKLTGEE